MVTSGMFGSVLSICLTNYGTVLRLYFVIDITFLLEYDWYYTCKPSDNFSQCHA